jgi:hypothetical protein
MKLTSGSKRADVIREIFYWVTFLRAADKLDNSTYGLIIGGLISAYFINRAYTDTKNKTKDIFDKEPANV